MFLKELLLNVKGRKHSSSKTQQHTWTHPLPVYCSRVARNNPITIGKNTALVHYVFLHLGRCVNMLSHSQCWIELPTKHNSHKQHKEHCSIQCSCSCDQMLSTLTVIFFFNLLLITAHLIIKWINNSKTVKWNLIYRFK